MRFYRFYLTLEALTKKNDLLNILTFLQVKLRVNRWMLPVLGWDPPNSVAIMAIRFCKLSLGIAKDFLQKAD